MKALPKSQRGVALVITLLFLVVTTIIVVAFLVRSQSDYQASASYSASVQSEALAASAADQVIANFLAEIADPDNSTTHKLGNDLTWFEPKDKGGTFPSMIPEIATNFGGARNNLIKQSLASTPFYSNAQPVASSVKSSEGERPVSGRRWDLPRLLLDDSGLVAGNFSDGDAPDWIYVQENGETTTSPAENIVGRYAYNVYDVGGLLNINVAGHETAAKAEDIAPKGALAFADLKQIGLGGAVDDIIAWRAPQVNWGELGDPNAKITGSPLSIMDFLRLGSNVGWMRNPTLNSSAGANQFLSRRDLIRFFDDKGIDPDALPFLTHFSVDADAPTFSPDTEILRVDAKKPSSFGGARASKLTESRGNDTIGPADQERINPPRYAEGNVIKDYQLPNDKRVEVPVLFKRFPLSRLALVQTDPSARQAAGSTDELTRKYFGLVAEDDFTWRYQDEEGSNDHIKTLDEVAEVNREPNFFEILKSVIQVGSLGQYRNPVTSTLDSLEPAANRVDDHILRIGAAIIDQADKDSYPTRIRFIYDGQTGFGEIYGVEDLPYLYAMKFVAYGKSKNAKQHYFIAQPILWNPHNPDRRNETKSPSSFQIKPLKPAGLIDIHMFPTSASGTAEKDVGVTTVGQFTDATTLTFNWDPGSENFRQPQSLLSSSYPPGANLQGGPGLAVHTQENAVYSPLNPYLSSPPIGFYLGRHDKDIVGREAQTVIYSSGRAQFQLQYQAPNGNFYAYDRLWFNPESVKGSGHAEHLPPKTFTSLFSGREDPLGGDLRSEAIYQKSDPRSHRFIWTSDIMYFSGYTNSGLRFALAEGTGPGWYRGIFTKLSGSTPTGWGKSTDYVDLWRFGTQANTGNDAEFRVDMGHLTINRNTSLMGGRGFYYSDHDGVVRRAMAGGIPDGELSKLAALAPPPKQYLPANENPASPAQPLPMQANAINSPNAKNLGQNFYQSRPIVLNRPFRSVGELAYTFRDVPWKNVDFAFSESGDTGLLDVFTIYENEGQPDSATPLVAGKVNLNMAPKPVLRALLAGTGKSLPTETSNTVEELDDIDDLIERFVEYRSTSGAPNTSPNGVNGPLRSLAEIVGRVYSSSKSDVADKAAFVGLHPEQVASGEDAVKAERISAITRALADVGTTRTWNVMIDLVAQSGKVPPGSQLEDFRATSESRWWVFVSIDRFTGKILAHSVERVVE